tara:strand:- start:190 stop:1836 length:1647 start_codon:yes stop_codon:yes gene_type:complete
LGLAQSQWISVKKWAFNTGGAVESSPAIGNDGTIYVGSTAKRIYAINPDGSKKWSIRTKESVYSSPTLGKDGTIYIGSWDYKLYAINPDGSVKWIHSTHGYVGYSDPVIANDGTIYIKHFWNSWLAHGSSFYELDAINPDGSQKLEISLHNDFSLDDVSFASPAVSSDGTIYLGASDRTLYAINSDGSKKWEYNTGDRSYKPSIGRDGTIYVRAWKNYLHAINSDGSKKWAFKTDDRVHNNPSIAEDGTIYLGAGENLYAINPDGSQKWAFEANDSVFSPTIGRDGSIYIKVGYNNLYAINPDGSQKWKSKPAYISSITIGIDGTIYIGSEDHHLYAINEYEINISDQSISKGQSLTLKYFPQPTFTYQWFYNAKEIPGATSISYTIENADLKDSGTYVLAIMDRTGKVLIYKPAVITVTPDSVEKKEDQLKIEINENGDRLLTFNPQDGKANWHIDFSGDLQDWKNLGKLNTNKTITDSRDSAEILLEQHTAKHGGFGIKTWSTEKGNLKSFDETKGQYEFLSPAEFAERFGLDYTIKQFYRARLVD